MAASRPTESPRARLDPVVAHARRLVAEHVERSPDAPVVIGLSGGADSLALVAVAAFFVERGASIRALVVDHGLQDGSADVARQAAQTATSLGVPASVARVNVDPTSPLGLEAAARNARHQALAAGPDGEIVWTAHTLDDQAETVILGLGRGSGPRSIAGMRRFTGVLDRPFLPLRRAQTEQICHAHGLTWWDDPHNEESRFRRVRVRREVLPLLEDVLGGGVAEALARTADLVREDADTLDLSAARARHGLGKAVEIPDLAAFAQLDLAIRTRIWRLLAIEAGALAGELSHRHTLALDSLLSARGGARIELPGGVCAERSGNRIHFPPTPVAV